MKKIISTIMEGIGISFIVANITFLIFLTEYSGLQIIYSYILWMTAGIFYGLAGLIHDTSINKFLVIGLHLLSNLLIYLQLLK